MRPFEPTLVTTRAARTRVIIGPSASQNNSIASAETSHSVMTSLAAMMSTETWAEKNRTLVIVFLPVVAAVFLVLAVAILAIVVLCICKACTAAPPRMPVRPFELTLMTTRAARSQVMIGQSASLDTALQRQEHHTAW